MSTFTSTHELRCRECGKTWGNQPRSICEDCFSPLEVTYDYDSIRAHISRDVFASRAPNMWRYRELLPLPAGYQPSLSVGFTPLVSAPRLGDKIGSRRLFVKNDAVCLPTLSFKDRVVAVALANARSFGFDTVSCSSTGNLANSVAAQSARLGLKACILVPADLEAAIRWYHDILGFDVEQRFEIPKAHAHVAMIKRGPLRMELFQVQDVKPLCQGGVQVALQVRAEKVRVRLPQGLPFLPDRLPAPLGVDP